MRLVRQLSSSAMPAKQQSPWPPGSQFERTQAELEQDTADWRASQTRQQWKQDRHEAHCEIKRINQLIN